MALISAEGDRPDGPVGTVRQDRLQNHCPQSLEYEAEPLFVRMPVLATEE